MEKFNKLKNIAGAKNIKKTLFILCIIAAFGCGIVFSDTDAPSVFVNGKKLETGALIIDGSTYIPLRAVSEALGAKVSWNQDAWAAGVDLDLGGNDAKVAGVIQSVSPSVVAIVGNYSAASSSYQDKYAGGMAHGTGVIIKSGGEILTNAHVVDGLTTIAVVLFDGSAYVGKVKYIDRDADLAVVKIDKLGLPIATFADGNTISVGDTVIAIGTPISFSLRNSASKGIISGMNRGVFSEYALIQTDASINPGNSGGPLVNMNGEIVGINSSKFAGVGIEGMGFSIPSDTVKYVLNQFETYGEVRRAGISATLSEGWAAQIGLPTNEGLKVEKVSGNTAMEGLLTNDEIISIDGTVIHSKVDFNEQMKNYKSGDSASFKIKRNGEELTVNLTLN